MSYENGRLPDSALSPIPRGKLAKGGPARSWLALRWYVHRAEGIWLTPTGPFSSYRPLWKQEELYAAYKSGRGPLAAVPSTSNHGLGRAVDVPTPQMQEAVRKYGHLFGWGIAGGKLPSDAPTEPWHCTYRTYTKKARRWYWIQRAARAGKR